jgi:hypothetical protein
MTPPSELPLAAMPIARPIFVLKYVDKMAMLGTNNAPVPTPTHTACARRTCQYVVHRLSIICPNTSITDPKIKRYRKYPASYSGPVNMPTISKRKA